MARNWVEYDEGPIHAGTGYYVTMNRIGEIVFNRYTYEQLEQPEALVLLFDPGAKLIGLKPASPLMPNAFLVKEKGNAGHRLIRAQPFATKHEIRLDNTVRFRTATIEDGILTLELRNMANASRKLRKKAGRR